MSNVTETGSQSNLSRFPQQSRDAKNCDGDADTELQNSHDDQSDVLSCQQVLYGQSRVTGGKNYKFNSIFCYFLQSSSQK